jgi:hypothetical protein
MTISRLALIPSPWVAVNDAPACQVIRRKFNENFISWQNPDEISPHSTGDMRQDFMPVV